LEGDKKMRFFNKYFFIGLGSGVVLTIVLIFAGLLVLRSLMFTPGKVQTRLPTPEFPSRQKVSVYDQADRWSIRTLDGNEVPFSQFKGKVVFLNFWATWCPPCVAEMPSIQNLYDSLKNEDTTFLLISHENEKTVKDFIVKKNFNMPVYLCRDGLPNVFRSRGIPATFILDRDGTIVFKHIGSAKWDSEACQNFIRGLM
jgi:peroxiredoxin